MVKPIPALKPGAAEDVFARVWSLLTTPDEHANPQNNHSGVQVVDVPVTTCWLRVTLR
jgi:hypothetical protein